MKDTKHGLNTASAEAATPVGVADHMLGTNGGFTMAVFKAADVPAGTQLYTAAPQASQPIEPHESLGEWVDVTKRLPERGQRIQGLSMSGAWIETFDPDEPIGHMTHWRAVDDDATDSTEQPDSASRCKHAYTGNSGDGYTCMFCMQPKDSPLVEIDSQPVSGAGMTEELILSTAEETCSGKDRFGHYVFRRSAAIEFVNALLSASGQAVSEKAVRDAALRDAEEAITTLYEQDEPPYLVDICRAIRALSPTPAQQTEAPVNVPGELLAGWKEAAIAWEVCASIHREYARGKDALFTTRQGDYVKHADKARALLAAAPAPVTTELEQPVQTEAQQVDCKECSRKQAQIDVLYSEAKRYKEAAEAAQQSEKDAERYRWLRTSGDSEIYLHNQPSIDNCKEIAGDGLDAAIDAAIDKEKANQKGGAA